MRHKKTSRWRASAVVAAICLTTIAQASIGDRLPEFKDCVQQCKKLNCVPGGPTIPLQRRLLLWDCPSECDYTCQHLITDVRESRDPPYREPVLQFHGKWPFYRFLGMQEPFSVLFSLLNFLAHDHGLHRLKESIPSTYALRKWYVAFGYMGMATWVFSMVFHTRDFGLTEKLDYFGAGASVLYGLYYTPIRIFHLYRKDDPQRASLLRIWTATCIGLYLAHVSYLTFWSWDYTYNMAANVVCGIVQNLLWTWFSIRRYRREGKPWTAWPGLIVAWLISAMSLELFDFPPWGRMVDAHSLWHLGTVGPTIWWYSFLIKDAQEDLQGMRLKV